MSGRYRLRCERKRSGERGVAEPRGMEWKAEVTEIVVSGYFDAYASLTCSAFG